MKNLILILFPALLFAQSNQISLTAGYKAIEISASYTAPNEVIYGLAFAGVDSKIAEKRANNRDINQHKFNDKYIPAVFGLLGGKFDNISVIGKLGTAYVNQDINGLKEKQKLYLAGGITFDFKMTETLSLRTSYDSVSSLLIGITYHL